MVVLHPKLGSASARAIAYSRALVDCLAVGPCATMGVPLLAVAAAVRFVGRRIARHRIAVIEAAAAAQEAPVAVPILAAALARGNLARRVVLACLTKMLARQQFK